VRRATSCAIQPPSLGENTAPFGGGWTAAGVIEVLEPLTLPRRVARIREVLAARLKSVTVVVDAPHDPHNGAAILRSCEAFGVQSLHVVERIEPFLVARTVSQGTEHWVDVFCHGDAAHALRELSRQNYELVVAHPQGELLPEDLARIERPALVMGNERDGVCEELTRAAAHTVRVPMRGFVESLNVSVTTALLVSAAVRGRAGDLTEEEQRFFLARALLHSVARAEAVLANLAAR
jgi:tRNA (guanosine-2'-O-)-methyltransferase